MADNQNNTQEYVDMLRKEISLLDTDEYIKKNGAERASMEDFLQKIEPLNMIYDDDYKVLYAAYLSSLSDKDLLDVCVRTSPDNEVVESVLKQRDSKRLGAIQHNTIVKLIETVNQYRSPSKKCIDYTALINELKDRYVFASKKDKRRILEVLLDGDESDRSWAYLLLSECWDNYFYDKIISVYNRYHDDDCIDLFSKYYPTGSLKGKIDKNELLKDKMAPCFYLGYLALFEKEIPPRVAEDILYKTIADTLYLYLYQYNNPHKPPTLLSIYHVKLVIRIMGAFGMKESLISFANICCQADEILNTDLQNLKRYRGRIFDEIISLLPPQYQTTNAAAEFDKYVDITKHCADNR